MLHLEQRWLRSNVRCEGCRLLQSVFPKELEGSVLSLRSLDEKPPFEVWDKWRNTIDPLFGMIEERVLLPNFSDEGELEFEKLKLPITNCIVEISPSKVEAALRALQKPRIDFGILRTWMEECLQTHTESCVSSSDHDIVHGLRLIEVRTRRIVPGNLGFEYAALSYVWGNMEASQCDDKLPQATPKTIEDALEVSHLLGLSYLWVDQYCIPQHDQAEKQSQIHQMHLIYKSAAITIIAAAGSGAEHGIPGINNTPLHGPPYLLTAQRRLLTTMCFRPATAVQFSSIWGSRGWTYQEAILSTRRLVFTERQIYFECNNPKSCSGIDEPVRRVQDPRERRLRKRGGEGFSMLSEGYDGPEDIWSHILMLSRRQLTWEADRINALMGIFGDFRKSNLIISQLYGIPITQPFNADEQSEIRTTWTNRFLAGLCWDLESPAVRRDQFPSWSWAGWEGQPRAVVDSDKGANLGVLKDFTLNDRISLCFELENGVLVQSEEFIRSSATATTQPRRVLHIEAPMLRFRFKPCEDFLYPILESTVHAIPIVKHTEILWNRLQLTKKIPDRTLCAEVWDGIPFESSDGYVRVLVLEPVSDHFQRLGHFDIPSDDFSDTIDFHEENGDGSLSLWRKANKEQARYRVILKRRRIKLQ